jgi:hypothetical protein
MASIVHSWSSRPGRVLMAGIKCKSYRVHANIFLNCVHGPNRKHVEHKETMFPIVYIVAKGVGLPAISCISLSKLPIDNRKPNAIHVPHPMSLCVYVMAGQMPHTSSSISSYHVFSRCGCSKSVACFKMLYCAMVVVLHTTVLTVCALKVPFWKVRVRIRIRRLPLQRD